MQNKYLFNTFFFDVKMIINKIFTKIEEFKAKNHLNYFATLYLNLRCLKFKDAIKFPIYVYGRPRLLRTTGTITIDCPVRKGMILVNSRRIGRMTAVTNNTEISLMGKITFKGSCYLLSGSVITVRKNATLCFGNDVVVGEGATICAKKSITTGNHVRIAHKCQIYDSSFHYTVDFNKRIIGDMAKPVSIGNYCWVGNSSTIAAGAMIPDQTIVASNSLVNKRMDDIPPMSTLAGIPCKLVKSGIKRVWCPECDNSKQMWIKKYFIENPDSKACPITDEMTPEFFDID